MASFAPAGTSFHRCEQSGRRHRDAGDHSARNDGSWFPLARKMPFSDAAVSGETGLKVAGGDAVLIGHKTAYDGAQTLDVEIGVLDIERIEGPLDQIDAAGERRLALGEFKEPASARVAIFLQHTQHVAVQVNLA